ncbi:MAG: enoyl-CoA hydratase/isomerase family protein, partial [Geminicoccaceae bacterium]
MGAVHLEIDGRIAELRLDNPGKLNALTVAMLGELEDHLRRIEHEASVGCVLLTATESRAFCSGADISGWGDLSPAEFSRHWIRDGHRVFDRLARLGKPTIAVIGAHAFGGGLELAVACDIRVMAPGAMLALPETSIGIVPGWSGTQRLARLLPEPVLKETVLFGRRLSAERAHALGLVAEVAEDPLAAAREIAARAVTLSPRATEIAKSMIHCACGEDRAAMVDSLASAAIAATDDRAEGVSAFR